MATHPKVLGLTLDPKRTYSTHIHNMSVQAHKPLQMIGWGKQKETWLPQGSHETGSGVCLFHMVASFHPRPTFYKLQVMQNAALRTATGCTQDAIIQHPHNETLIHKHIQLHASQYKQKIQHPSYPLHKHTPYFNTPRQKPSIFNNGRYTTHIPTDLHTVTTTDIKTNMRHIHTSIVSRHLATRGNHTIMYTPPPHIRSSEEILPCLTRRTLVQLRTNKSPFLKSYLLKHTPSPLCPLCNTHIHNTHHLFNCTHIHITLSPLNLTPLLDRWTEKLAGGPQAGRSDSPH